MGSNYSLRQLNQFASELAQQYQEGTRARMCACVTAIRLVDIDHAELHDLHEVKAYLHNYGGRDGNHGFSVTHRISANEPGTSLSCRHIGALANIFDAVVRYAENVQAAVAELAVCSEVTVQEPLVVSCQADKTVLEFVTVVLFDSVEQVMPENEAVRDS